MKRGIWGSFDLSFIVPSILLTMLLASAAAAAQPPARRESIQLAQVTIEQRVIIRIPTVPPPGTGGNPRGTALNVPPPAPPEPPVVRVMKEVKGPKCIKLGKIRRAIISQASGITMVTDEDEQYRAHFGRTCQPADFYSGFYIEPNEDGALCAGRDLLHARNGSNCNIERFSRLVPQP